jgi:hypothetical protein
VRCDRHRDTTRDFAADFEGFANSVVGGVLSGLPEELMGLSTTPEEPRRSWPRSRFLRESKPGG